MALWDSALWDASNWDTVAGQMAATESSADTFAGEGDVIVAGTMAATETGVDTFASAGTVQVTGEMAAVETGVDVFAASGIVQVTGFMAAVETGEDVLVATGEVTPQPVIFTDRGDYAEAHKRARKKRDEELANEKREKARLRQVIAEAIDPSIRQAKSVEVIAQDGAIQVVAEGSAVSIPVPIEMQLEVAQRMVATALERARIASVQIINEAEMRRRAQIEMARIAKRRRDDELILLME